MRVRKYYTLWASLPPLPDFTTADRLPINRQRLDARLNMLDEDDHAQLYVAAPLLAWDREAVARVDDQVARQYDTARRQLSNPVLQAFVDGQLENRTILAALRRRRLGQHSPRARSSRWGVGERVRWIGQHWDDPNFKLDAPFLVMATQNPIEQEGTYPLLQRLMLGLAWRELGQITERHPFRFEAIFAYAFKWGILNRWLTYNAETAVARFHELVTEGTGEHEASIA